MVRAFQSFVTTSTDEWLRSGVLARPDVHELLTGTLMAIRDQVRRRANS